MIKALIFDWGGVVHMHRWNAFDRYIARAQGVRVVDFKRIELQHRLAHDLGAISTKEFLRRLNRDLGTRIAERAYYRALYSKRFVVFNRPLLALIKKLKPRYKIFVLSNNSEPIVPIIKKYPNVKRLFDKMLFSYQVKMKKPDPRFFRHLLRGTGIRPRECVFVDDRADLTAAAAKLGMQAIIYTDFKSFKQALVKKLPTG